LSEYTKYPDQIDTSTELPKATDLVTPVNGESVNRLRSAILAVENELGIQPSATFSTVKARLDNFDSRLISLGSDLDGFDPTIDILQDDSLINNSVNSINFTGAVSLSSEGNEVTVNVIGGQATQIQESVLATAAQTTFTLSNTPFQASGVLMYVNGVKLRYAVDYTVSGNTVTYLDTPALEVDDEVEFWYLIDSSGLSIIDARQEVAFSSLLTFNGNYYTEFENSGSPEPCIIGILAGATHIDGASYSIFIPANEATELRASVDLGYNSWDVFDSSKPYLINILYTNGNFASTGSVLENRVVDAPLIISAEVGVATPDKLTVVWDQDIYITEDLSGLSLSFSSGTPVTITGIDSGNGTDTVIFSLSGSVIGTDVFSFVVSGARESQSLDGDLITVESENVALIGF